MLLSLSGVTFGYAAEDIFRNLTLAIHPGEHTGVVGPNGHGKSTLLRILAGRLPVDTGVRTVRRGTEVGYLRQSQEFPDDVSVHDLLLATFAEVLEARAKLDAVQLRMEGGDDSPGTLDAFGEAQYRFEELGGYGLEARAEALAAEVGLTAEDLSRSAGSLSGGERSRFELARVLLRNPELLLLDEPTNHLDLTQTERLERRLAEYSGAFLLVSHDRAFLRATCTTILEVEHRGAARYPGGYDHYRKIRRARLDRAFKEFVAQNERVRATEDFVRRNIAGQKTKQAQARRKMLEKIDKLARPEDVWEAAGNLGFGFASAEHPGGRESFVAKGLSVGHAGQPPLIEGLDWTLHRGDRVGIVGPNGAGKTTLAKVLLGKARPLAGLAELGYRVSPGYLDQKLEGIRDERTLIEEVQSVRPDFKPEEARNALGRYRFLGDDAHRAAGGLSGGERCRLAMLKLSLVPCNLLLLDEPTNHLDIPAQEVLERALAEYEGTLLVVSHDRDFLDAVTTRTLLVDDGKAALHEGCYSRARARWTERAKAAASATAPPPAEEAAPPKGAQTREASRSRRSELQKLRNRKGALERNIEALEARSGELHEQLAEDPAGDWERLHRLSAEEREVAARLERRVQEWERVCTRLESLGGASS